MISKKIPIIDVKKYGGKQVAIFDGEIVATGRTANEVIRRAQNKFPAKPVREFLLLSVPKSVYVIYHVS